MEGVSNIRNINGKVVIISDGDKQTECSIYKDQGGLLFKVNTLYLGCTISKTVKEITVDVIHNCFGGWEHDCMEYTGSSWEDRTGKWGVDNNKSTALFILGI